MARRSELARTLGTLSRSPGFTVTVVLVLAVGIGASVAVFCALDQTVIRPLPFGDPDRLAVLYEDFSVFGIPKNRVSPATFFDWRHRAHAFVDLAAMRRTAVDLADSGPPEQVSGAAITANLLPLIRVEPQLGRGLLINEEAPGYQVVVLADSLWRRRFGGDPTILGRSILMSGESYAVVGVMPPGFHFPDATTEFWVPLALKPALAAARNSHILQVVGRLRPEVTWTTARDDMGNIARQLAVEFPATNARTGVIVTPLKEDRIADAGHALLLLLGASACVLLIACANVANLMLVRAAKRRRETALQLALGASWGRLVRERLLESLVLSGVGGLLGLTVARLGLQLLKQLIPPALAASIAFHLDTRSVVFASVLAIATAVLFGVVPALQAVHRVSTTDLAGRASLGHDWRGAALRPVLVVAEVAISLVLVVGAALLVQTLVSLRAVDPGFRADHLLTAQIEVPYPKYADPTRRRQFYADVLAGVQAIIGVERVGLTSDLPYTSRSDAMPLGVEGQVAAPAGGQNALFRLVSADYLATMGAKLQAGRFLDDRDREGALPVVVVNRALASTYWPNQAALGRRVDTGTGDGTPLWMTIVGVVEDVQERGLDFGSKPTVYVPFTQTTIGFFQPSEIAVRSSRRPETLAKDLQRAVWAVDPTEPVTRIRTMDDIVDGELGDREHVFALLSAFAAVALLFTVVGLYAVLSYLVSDRRQEIGLRMALGAGPAKIVYGVLREAAALTGVGIGLGVAVAAAVTRVLGSLLFNVSPVDPFVFAAVSALMAITALAAAYLPARRAGAIDPLVALRSR